MRAVAHIQKQKVCEFHLICILGQLADLSSRLPVLAFERDKGKCKSCIFALGLVMGHFVVWQLWPSVFEVLPFVLVVWHWCCRLSGPFDSLLHQGLLVWTFYFSTRTHSVWTSGTHTWLDHDHVWSTCFAFECFEKPPQEQKKFSIK